MSFGHISSWLKKKALSCVMGSFFPGVVGCGEDIMYLTSPGRPTDIGFQLGKACYPCNR